MDTTKNGRIIGIRFRCKKTKDGEARPTQVHILNPDGSSKDLELDSEQAEVDFAYGQLPIAWRDPTPEDDHAKLPFSHKKWKEIDAEKAAGLPSNHVLTKGKKTKKFFALVSVACEFEGVKAGDRVAMSLGAGNAFAFKMANRGKTIDATVWRLSTQSLKDARGTKDKAAKEADAKLLAELLRDKPGIFHRTEKRHADISRLRELYLSWTKAQKERIACGQRLLELARNRPLLGDDDTYPMESVEETAEKSVNEDAGYKVLVKKEEDLKKEIEEILKKIWIYNAFFEPIDGIGPALAVRLIAAIQDIRRFWVELPVEDLRNSYARSDEAELLGGFERDIPNVADRLKSTDNRYRMLQLVRSWQMEHGKVSESTQLDLALAEYDARRRMRLKTHSRGAARLKAYCGVHLIKIGFDAKGEIVPKESPNAVETKWVLPTRRVMGAIKRPANWREEARKALYLFADQANKRKDSDWGKKRRAFKIVYAERHADKSKGQVHDASCWRMASRLIEALFDAWTKYEDGERHKTPKPTAEEDAKTHDKPRRWATYAEWQKRPASQSAAA